MNIHESSWIEVCKHAKEDLSKNLLRLESESLDYCKTQYVRGKISALRSILDLPNKKIIEKIETEDY